MQIRKTLNNVLIFLFLGITSLSGLAQVRSSTIQTIDGTKYYIHKVEKSQSLYGISKLYAVSVDDLLRVNPELKNGAKADQLIKVPAAPAQTVVVQTQTVIPTPPIDTLKYLTYKVSKGETSYSIARKFNLSEKEFNKLNPTAAQGLRENQLVVVGEKTKKKTNPVKELGQIFAPKDKNQPIVDTAISQLLARPKKPSYNVSVILPFKLNQVILIDNNELVRNNSPFPSIPALAVDFYLGFKRAADSLRSPDFSVNITPFDVDDRDTAKLDEIWKATEFKNTDMIFGPLYANGFKSLSKKAKEFSIPIVSPITSQNKILYNNIYISKTNPSQFTLLESLADYCIDSLVKGDVNIVLMILNEKDKKELGFVNAFKKYYNEKQKTLGKLPKDTVTIAKGINGLKQRYKSSVPNIIISLSNNQVMVTDFTTQLTMVGKGNITLCGWQSITEMDNIDQEYLNQLNYVFPHQYNITGEANYKQLNLEYEKIQETTPSEYFYMGFDIGYYYLKQLKEVGPGFIYSLDTLPFDGNYIRFKFTRPDNQTGFDNRGVYIFRYNNYQLTRTGWK